MKSLVICKSVHQGNTRKVAEVIAKALKAEIKDPSEVNDVSSYDLIGFGSGIYMMRHHESLFKLLDRLDCKGKKAFVFSTSGGGEEKDNNALKKRLVEKGFNVVGNFVCKGLDKFGPFAIIGGLNKGHPDKDDLKKAEDFALFLLGLN
jgi:flavodoxin